MAEYVIDSLAISKGPNTFILDPAAVVEPILDAKADKVDGATSGNFAGLDANGNLVDSGHKHSDYLTEHQDISGKLDVSEKGAVNGVAELDSAGKVPSSQLPSYVDDVLEFNTINDFPATGESGKIYIAKDTNLSYRWSGSTYVKIASDLALGETSSTAYRGDRGKAAYDHATAKGSAFTSGFYKIATNAEGHVTSASAVEKSDITNLGIPGEIQVHDFDSLEDFPAEGAANNLYIDDDTNMVYRWDTVNEEYVPVSGSGGSSALYKIPFTIEASDWTSDSDGYTATIQNTRINAFSEELVLYDSSIADMPGNISINKNGSTNSLIFSIDALPSVSLNGTIYSLIAEAIVIDGKLDVNQGAQNVGKILEVNSEGNLTLINNNKINYVEYIRTSAETFESMIVAVAHSFNSETYLNASVSITYNDSTKGFSISYVGFLSKYAGTVRYLLSDAGNLIHGRVRISDDSIIKNDIDDNISTLNSKIVTYDFGEKTYSEFITALDSLCSGMQTGDYRHIHVYFTTSSGQFSATNYVGFVECNYSGIRYSITLLEQASNGTIRGTKSSNGWYWDSYVLNEQIATQRLDTGVTGLLVNKSANTVVVSIEAKSTSNSAIYTLPNGWRPVQFYARGIARSDSTGYTAKIVIKTNGEIMLTDSSPGTIEGTEFYGQCVFNI